MNSLQNINMFDKKNRLKDHIVASQPTPTTSAATVEDGELYETDPEDTILNPEYGNTIIPGHRRKKNNTTGLKRKPNESRFEFRSRVVRAGLAIKKAKNKNNTVEDLEKTKSQIENKINNPAKTNTPIAGHTLYKEKIGRLHLKLATEKASLEKANQ